MLLLKKDNDKSRLENFIKKINKRLIKLDFSKIFLRAGIGFFLGIPFLIGTSTIGNKLIKKLPESVRLGISYQVEYLNLSEILKYTSLKTIYRWPLNYLRGNLTSPENINLNITQERLTEFQKEVNLSKKLGLIYRKDNSYKKATLSYKDEIYPVRIRLKGDELDHIQDKRWSFRVKIGEDKNLFGMRKFSLQTPKVRNYLGESIYHKFLSYRGVPSLRYKFLNLSVNGKSLGTYALEEHFDKLTIENNNLREGIIIGLDENTNFLEAKRAYPDRRIYLDGYYLKFPTKILDSKSILEDNLLREQYFEASKQLNKFLNGDLSASDVFEIDKLSKFLAISDLTGANHGLYWENLRFIYNPLNKKLIPLGYDGIAGYKTHVLSNQTGAFKNAFKDDFLFRGYISEVEKITQEGFLDQFFKLNNKQLTREINLIHRSYPWEKTLSDYKKTIKYNAGFIKQILNPKNPLDIGFEDISLDNIYLSVSNKSEFPILLKEIQIDGQIINNSNILLNPRDSYKRGKYKTIKLDNKYKISINDIQNIDPDIFIKYSLVGSEKIYTNKIPFKFVQKSNNKFENNFLLIKDNLYKFNFIEKNDLQKIISFKAGSWIIDEPLVIPEGYTFKIRKGTKILLKEKGLILSRSPLDFVGEVNNPIEISAELNGMGLFVFNANKKSKMHFVEFKGLSVPIENSIKITGAVTFYNSPVEIVNCLFDSNRSEDSLNIISSIFFIKDTVFSNSKYDALDIDFGDGKLQNIKFINLGNDGFDISGTKVIANKIFINNALDKAISVGEKSELKAYDISIINSSIGIASKDLSSVFAEKVIIKGTDIALVAFQKKPEFGPASIKIELMNANEWLYPKGVFDALSEIQSKKLYLLESPSSIIVNKFSLNPNVKDLRSKLYKEK